MYGYGSWVNALWTLSHVTLQNCDPFDPLTPDLLTNCLLWHAIAAFNMHQQLFHAMMQWSQTLRSTDGIEWSLQFTGKWWCWRDLTQDVWPFCLTRPPSGPRHWTSIDRQLVRLYDLIATDVGRRPSWFRWNVGRQYITGFIVPEREMRGATNNSL